MPRVRLARRLGAAVTDEPRETVLVYWVETPSADYFETLDGGMRLRDPLRAVSLVLWRGRWCKVTDELVDELGRLDRDQSIEIVFERCDP